MSETRHEEREDAKREDAQKRALASERFQTRVNVDKDTKGSREDAKGSREDAKQSFQSRA